MHTSFNQSKNLTTNILGPIEQVVGAQEHLFKSTQP